MIAASMGLTRGPRAPGTRGSPAGGAAEVDQVQTIGSEPRGYRQIVRVEVGRPGSSDRSVTRLGIADATAPSRSAGRAPLNFHMKRDTTLRSSASC